MKTILLTGANGLLGQKAASLLALDAEVKVAASGVGDPSPCLDLGLPWYEADLTDPAGLETLVSETAPDLLLHLGAMTNVDGCEDRSEEAHRINGEATGRLAGLMADRGGRMVYVSTEYVFDGCRGPYSEEDEPHALSVYGMSKLHGEMLAREALSNLAVARTTVLFGTHCMGEMNFVTWLLGELEAHREVSIVCDQIGSPTLADNLAGMLEALLLSSRTGVYNTAGADVIGRYDFALRVAEVFGLDAGLIRSVTTEALSQKAVRPLKGGLRMDKFKRDFPHVPVLGVEEALQNLKGQIQCVG